jgi:hypothetical protein
VDLCVQSYQEKVQQRTGEEEAPRCARAWRYQLFDTLVRTGAS